MNLYVFVDLWHLRSVVAIIGKGFSEASFTTAFLFTSELYPTVIRSVTAIRAYRMHLFNHYCEFKHIICSVFNSVVNSHLEVVCCSVSEATRGKKNGQ